MSSEISEFSLGTASSAAVSGLSLCSYLGSSVSVVFVSLLVCVALGASIVSVTTGLIFSVVFHICFRFRDLCYLCIFMFVPWLFYTVDCDSFVRFHYTDVLNEFPL